MKVITKSTLLNNDVFYHAGTIFDSSVKDIPEHILELANLESPHVEVIESDPIEETVEVTENKDDPTSIDDLENEDESEESTEKKSSLRKKK